MPARKPVGPSQPPSEIKAKSDGESGVGIVAGSTGVAGRIGSSQAGDASRVVATAENGEAATATDETLAIRLRDGDATAGEILVARFYTALTRYLYRLAGSEHLAEELHQQTWLSVLDHLSKFDAASSGGGFKAWLFRIATNKASDHWRSRGRAGAAAGEPAGAAAGEPPEAAAEARPGDGRPGRRGRAGLRGGDRVGRVGHTGPARQATIASAIARPRPGAASCGPSAARRPGSRPAPVPRGRARPRRRPRSAASRSSSNCGPAARRTRRRCRRRRPRARPRATGEWRSRQAWAPPIATSAAIAGARATV